MDNQQERLSFKERLDQQEILNRQGRLYQGGKFNLPKRPWIEDIDIRIKDYKSRALGEKGATRLGNYERSEKESIRLEQPYETNELVTTFDAKGQTILTVDGRQFTWLKPHSYEYLAIFEIHFIPERNMLCYEIMPGPATIWGDGIVVRGPWNHLDVTEVMGFLQYHRCLIRNDPRGPYDVYRSDHPEEKFIPVRLPDLIGERKWPSGEKKPEEKLLENPFQYLVDFATRGGMKKDDEIIQPSITLGETVCRALLQRPTMPKHPSIF
jgi:hypothetical protein